MAKTSASRGDARLNSLARGIEGAQAELLARRMQYLAALDESEIKHWPEIIRVARAADIGKETLCRELSCAWSTVLRWEAGHTVPGPNARRGIKARLMELLQARAMSLAPEKARARLGASVATTG
jgi:hypothetical protein